jgi:putative heme-binding domain-containing protein
VSPRSLLAAAAGLAALLSPLAGECADAAAPASERPSADDLARGERLFLVDCAGCHGPRGEGERGPPLAVPRLSRSKDTPTLVKVIQNGVDGTEMPSARRTSRELRQLAAWVLSLGQRPAEAVPGDPAAGEKVYLGKGACRTCHTLRGRGGALGPDLTDIGLRRGAAYLRTSLIKPEADLPRSFSPYRGEISLSQNFLQVRAVTRKGEEIVGARINEDTFSIQIRDAANRVRSFFKDELRVLDKQWGRTPMPSYEGVLTGEEIGDLVAFLASLRGDAGR